MRIFILLSLFLSLLFISSVSAQSGGDLDSTDEEALKVLSNQNQINGGRQRVDIVSASESTDDDDSGLQVRVNGQLECQYQRQTKVHSTNPNMYYYRFWRENGAKTRCEWTRWRSKEFAVKPFPKAVQVDGRWYESPGSNRVYLGYGKWRVRKAIQNPRNPNLVKIGGKWTPKPQTALSKLYFKGPDDRWYRNSQSAYYFKNGQWVRQRPRPHPFDPRLFWRSGSWQRKPKAMMPRGWRKKWSLRNGKWYKAKPGVRPGCFIFYKNGRWITDPALRAKGNDPRYRYTKDGRFVRRPATATRKFVKRGDRWYKNAKSRRYFKDGRWVLENPKHRDPRYRRSGKRWIRVKRNKAWVHDKKAHRWYRSISRDQFWQYGRWRNIKQTKAMKRVAKLEAREEALDASPPPLDLEPIVNKATRVYFRRFLKWFLKDYLGATVQKQHLIRTDNPYVIEPGRSHPVGMLSSPYEPEGKPMAPPLVPRKRVVKRRRIGPHYVAAPIDLSERNPLMEDPPLSAKDKKKLVTLKELEKLRRGDYSQFYQ